MARKPTHALIHQASLDMRSAPDHRAELTSQLLLGEAVAVLDARRREWWRVENLADGYRGWVRTWGLAAASGRSIVDWKRQATARVRVPFTEARAPGNGRGRLTPLFWNTALKPGRINGRFRSIALPDGRRGLVERRALALPDDPPPSLRARVTSLMGTPYLWGGRTPLGIDCSGFSQQLAAEQGLGLPRDADAQFRAAHPLGPREAPKPGDLVFFGPSGEPIGHVGVLLGANVYAHARGTVRLSSLDPHNPLWESELAHQIRGIRRPGVGFGV